MIGKDKLAVLSAEFLGTAVLTYIFLSVQHSSIGIAYFIALAAGLTLALLTFLFASTSGAHLNPAVTIGLWTARQIKTAPAVVYIIVQLFGAWVAYELFAYLFNQPVTALYDPNVTGGSAHFELRTLIAEAAGTFVFTIGWAAALYRRYRGPVLGAAIGVSFALGILVAAVSGFGLINPALALGTRTWHIWSGAGWGTYILGPVVGSVVGFNLYHLLFRGNDKKVVAASASSSNSKTTKSSKKSKK